MEQAEKQPIIIGTNWDILKDSNIITAHYTREWRGREIPIQVTVGKLLFGKEKEYSVPAIYTSSVDVAQYLMLNGHGSHCYVDESQLMLSCAMEFLETNGLTISRVQCTWPMAQIIVADTWDSLISKFGAPAEAAPGEKTKRKYRMMNRPSKQRK